jgi:NADH-quinone oxidoreductase subunit E
MLMGDDRISGVERVLEKHGGAGREKLIPILQEVQEEEGYLSRPAIHRIGEHLRVPVADVYGVATFYNQFRFKPAGRYQVTVCRGTACHVKGSLRVLETLQQELRVEPGQTTPDGCFGLEVVACLGACGLAPAMHVNGEFHAGTTPAKARSIVADYRSRGAGAEPRPQTRKDNAVPEVPRPQSLNQARDTRRTVESEMDRSSRFDSGLPSARSGGRRKKRLPPPPEESPE